MKYLDAFFMTLSMFCAVPCPYRPWREEARPLMSLFLPAVGAVIGGIWALSVFLCRFFDVPVPLIGAVTAAAPYLITGFFHLDGFMDTNDALLSRRSLEERLRILKDSTVGAFSVISVGLLFMFSYAAGLSFAQKGSSVLPLLFIPISSRICAALAVTCMKPLEHSQYNRGKNQLNRRHIAILLLQAAVLLAIMWLIGGKAAAVSATAAALFYALALFNAVHDLGGFSGDLSGYALTFGELGALVVCALL